MRRFPSRDLVCCGIIRMHEPKTCEITLLQSPDSPVWSSSKTMFLLQENLVDPSEEAWASKNPYSIRRFKPGLSGKIYSGSFGQAPIRCRAGKLPPSIPSDTTPFCRTSKPSEASFRSVNPISRRALLLLSKKTLGLVSYGTQALCRKNSRFFRSHTPSTKGKRCKMVASPRGGHSSQSQSSDLRSCRRQFEWYEETCQTRRMGPPALSFSFDSKIPNPASSAKTSLKGWNHARGHISIDVSNSRGPERTFAQRFNHPTDPISPKSLHHISNPSYAEGLPQIYRLLPSVPDSPGTQSAVHNQHHRIDELHHPGFTTKKPFGLKPSITLTMGNSADSTAKEIKLQRQTSSTDLINATPNCDMPDSGHG